jgi:hypothetical protein
MTCSTARAQAAGNFPIMVQEVPISTVSSAPWKVSGHDFLERVFYPIWFCPYEAALFYQVYRARQQSNI